MLTIIVVVQKFKLAGKLNRNNHLHVYDNRDLFEIGTAIILAVVVLAVVMSPTQHLQLPLDYYRNIIHQCMLLNHKEKILSGASFEQLNKILPISDYLPSSSSSLLPLTESDINSLPLLQSVSDGSDYRTAALIKIMSSIEFIKPHPKQVRYSNNNNNSANNGSTNHNNNSSNNNNNFNASSNSSSNSSSGINLNSIGNSSNNNSNLVNNNDDNNSSRNNIPIYLHDTKYISNYQNNTVSSLSHAATNQLPSSSELIEQIGPVNLVTNNNSNNSSNNNNSSGSNSSIRSNNINNSIYNSNSISNINNNNNNNNSNNNSINSSSNTIKSSSLPQQQQILTNNKHQLSSKENTDIMAGIYAQKLSFTTPNIATVNNVSAAAAAAAYQFNYPHIYGRDTIYGTTAAALYSNHHLLNNRSHQLHNRNAYVGIQHEPYPTPHYVSSPVNYGSSSVPPSSVIAAGISRPPPSHSPHSQSMRSINHHPTTSFISSNNSNSHNNVMTNTLCATQLRIIPDSRQHSNLTHHAINLADSEKHISHIKLPSPSETHDKEPVRNSLTTTYTHEITTAGEERFKIPSGKEGSLKHRILTRPLNCEKETKRSPSITATIVRSQTTSSTTASNFSKGAFIELANGTLRKVEDMRTEDFIQSAEKSPCHQLTNSTVVKIVSTSNSVIITFAYDKNRSKANVEVPQEHPFFVYGQGWASCNPELSLQTFGLECQHLQIGDTCISLTLRDPDQNNMSSSPTNDNIKEELLPQNLSNKPLSIVNFSTMPTTATETIVTSRLNPTAPPSIAHHLPLSLHHSSIPGLPSSSSTHHLYENLSPYEMNSSMSLITKHHSPSSPITKDILSTSSYRQYLLRQQQQHHHQQQQHRHSEQQEYHPPLKTMPPFSDTRYASRSKISGNSQMSPPLSLSAPSSRPPSNQQVFYFGPDKTNNISKQHSLVSSSTPGDGDGVSNLNVYGISGKNFISVTEQQQQQQFQEQQQATNYETSLSRKRRWSAPDNICDDEQKISNKIMINS